MALAVTDTLNDIAQEASVVFEGRCSLPSFSARYPSFAVDEAYRVSALAHEMRLGKGYRPVGRKAGFTNRRIWDEYGVHAPNWGYVYDRSLHDLATPTAACTISPRLYRLRPTPNRRSSRKSSSGFLPRPRRVWMT